MKWSQFFIPTVKEIPADAEVPSHQLMIRAGIMRKVASGTYAYLPLGWRSLLKAIQIVREEMDAAGALESLMPSVQPMELWQRTGRDVDYGETLGRFKDRHGRWNVLSPTAEEVMTYIAAGEINSYKQLPFNLYQISFKYRDEFRPRFGVLRSREFIMKDAYSFDADADSLHTSYMKMYNAYCRIFERCGLDYVIVQAETGEMGGSGSHQFTIPCETGEDIIVHTEDGSYAANIEKAAVDPLPAHKTGAEIPPPEEIHTPAVGSIEAVCEFLKTKPANMIKTLIYQCQDQPVVVLVRGDHEVNPEKLTQIMQGKHIELASPEIIESLTGAAVGFAGPMNLAGKCGKMIIDHAVAALETGVTGANKTDYHVKNVVPGRDFPLAGDNIIVTDVRNAVEGDTYEGKKLLFRHGIEVGQVFKLGTKYSEKLGAKFLDENGTEKPCLMGCYGIGINRIIASAIEANHDKDGIIWPISIAPFSVLMTTVNQDDDDIIHAATDIYQQLSAKHIEVLWDDRQLRAGVKFKDADLVGIPIRLTIGKKALSQGNVEIKLRRENERRTIPLAEAVDTVQSLIKNLQNEVTPRTAHYNP